VASKKKGLVTTTAKEKGLATSPAKVMLTLKKKDLVTVKELVAVKGLLTSQVKELVKEMVTTKGLATVKEKGLMNMKEKDMQMPSKKKTEKVSPALGKHQAGAHRQE
jgi:hypothetical protein